MNCEPVFCVVERCAKKLSQLLAGIQGRIFQFSSVGPVANAMDVLQPLRLILQPYSPVWLVITTFTARCLHACNNARDPSRERWNYVSEKLPEFCLNATYTSFRDLLHAVNLQHGTDGFTSPPKEGVLRIFSLRPGLNPRTWVLKASTLPLVHRSRYSVNMEAKLVTYATVRFTIHCHKRDININEITLNFGLMFKITPHCHAHAE